MADSRSVHYSGSLTDVGSIKVGHFSRTGNGYLTGTTVVLTGQGAVAGVDVRGGGPGTRETDVLQPENLVQRVHGIVLTGGSAYGLGAAQGVMDELEDQHVGYPVGESPQWVVPIVPAAVIFDLGRGGNFRMRPDASFGRRAAKRASTQTDLMGTVGAGTGARSGGLRGGLGMASMTLADGVIVSALAVVNSIGSVINPETALPWDLNQGRLQKPSAVDRRRLNNYLSSLQQSGKLPKSPSLNTTIGVVATNQSLTKSECKKFASVAHDGLARAIRPAHLMNDGDTIFGVSVAQGDLTLEARDPAFIDPHGRPAFLNAILAAGAQVFSRACTEAILTATSTKSLPCYRELCPSAFSDMP